MSQNLTLIIPAYQPAPALVELVQELLERCERVLVVDDGSADSCRETFDQIETLEGALVLRHETNQGKGAAMKTALAWCRKHLDEPYWVITVDADGQHRPDDVQKLAEKIGETEDHALIMGERAFAGEVPLRSRFGNALTRVLTGLVHGLWLNDTQTGLRAFDNHLALAFESIPQNRYEFEMEMLIRAAQEKVRIVSIPIETVYLDENESSHFQPLYDSARIYFVLFRFVLASLIGTLIDFGLFALMVKEGLDLQQSFWTARLTGGLINFLLNRSFTFHSKSPLLSSGFKYFAWWGVLGSFTYSLTIWLASTDRAILMVRAIAEIVAYLANFFVQKLWIFTKR